MLTGEEVAAHNSKNSCWVVIAGAAYDVTDVRPASSFVKVYIHPSDLIEL